MWEKYRFPEKCPVYSFPDFHHPDILPGTPPPSFSIPPTGVKILFYIPEC